MKTKIVYVLVSTPQDCYLEQTLISAYSARLHNPNAHISVAIDRESYDGLSGKRAEIKKYVTEFIVIDVPSTYTNMQKSRFIKTNLRSYVSGDILYIDSDTVISDSLEEVDSFTCDLGAVADSNRSLPIGISNYVSDSYIIHHTNNLGWPPVIGYPNYNGGVMYAKDSAITHQFYSRWFELWEQCVEQNVNIDMPALCRTNMELGCCIQELPGIWNCQIQRQGMPLLPEAKIIHCFTGGNLTFYELCSERILDKIKGEGKLDKEIILLIKNAKTAFATHTTIIDSRDANLLKRPIVQLFYINPTLFRILNKLVLYYFKLRKIEI